MKIIFIIFTLFFADFALAGDKKAIILIGPPASGKGYLANKIIANSQYKHVSVGDILRQSKNKDFKEKMKNGSLVSEGAVFEELGRYLDEKKYENIILDGVPRSESQIKLLDSMLKTKGFNIEKIVFIECPNDVLEERMKGRVAESKVKRDDDNSEVFKERIGLYYKNLIPIATYYDKNFPKQSVHLSCKSADIYADFVKISK